MSTTSSEANAFSLAPEDQLQFEYTRQEAAAKDPAGFKSLDFGA